MAAFTEAQKLKARWSEIDKLQAAAYQVRPPPSDPPQPSRHLRLSGRLLLEVRSNGESLWVCVWRDGQRSGTRPGSSRFDSDMRWVSKTTSPKHSLRPTLKARDRTRRRFRLLILVRRRRIRAYVPPLPLPLIPPKRFFALRPRTQN